MIPHPILSFRALPSASGLYSLMHLNTCCSYKLLPRVIYLFFPAQRAAALEKWSLLLSLAFPLHILLKETGANGGRGGGAGLKRKGKK